MGSQQPVRNLVLVASGSGKNGSPECISVHRELLALASPVLRDMLGQDVTLEEEDRLQVPEDADAWQAVVDWLHAPFTASPAPSRVWNASTVAKLLPLAHKYAMHGLVQALLAWCSHDGPFTWTGRAWTFVKDCASAVGRMFGVQAKPSAVDMLRDVLQQLDLMQAASGSSTSSSSTAVQLQLGPSAGLAQLLEDADGSSMVTCHTGDGSSVAVHRIVLKLAAPSLIASVQQLGHLQMSRAALLCVLEHLYWPLLSPDACQHAARQRYLPPHWTPATAALVLPGSQPFTAVHAAALSWAQQELRLTADYTASPDEHVFTWCVLAVQSGIPELKQLVAHWIHAQESGAAFASTVTNTLQLLRFTVQCTASNLLHFAASARREYTTSSSSDAALLAAQAQQRQLRADGLVQAAQALQQRCMAALQRLQSVDDIQAAASGFALLEQQVEGGLPVALLKQWVEVAAAHVGAVAQQHRDMENKLDKVEQQLESREQQAKELRNEVRQLQRQLRAATR